MVIFVFVEIKNTLYFKFTATNRMSVINLWTDIFGAKVDYFQHFFRFFEYHFRAIHFRTQFCLLKSRPYGQYHFHFLCDNFHQNYNGKKRVESSNLHKFENF